MYQIHITTFRLSKQNGNKWKSQISISRYLLMSKKKFVQLLLICKPIYLSAANIGFLLAHKINVILLSRQENQFLTLGK